MTIDITDLADPRLDEERAAEAALEPTETETPELAKYQVMPPLAPDDFEALKASIKANGVLIPIEYDEDGNILDGHHRVRACKELRITDWPRVVRTGLTEAEKRAHARSLNLARRHLSSKQKRALIAAQLVETPEQSDRSIADGLGVSPTTVGTVRADLEARDQIGHAEKRTDTTGRQQPASKPKPAPDPTVSTAVAKVTDVDTSEEVAPDSRISSRVKARFQKFDDSFSLLMCACESGGEMAVPDLSGDQTNKAIRQIEKARKQLATLKRRIAEANRDKDVQPATKETTK